MTFLKMQMRSPKNLSMLTVFCYRLYTSYPYLLNDMRACLNCDQASQLKGAFGDWCKPCTSFKVICISGQWFVKNK